MIPLSAARTAVAAKPIAASVALAINTFFIVAPFDLKLPTRNTLFAVQFYVLGRVELTRAKCEVFNVSVKVVHFGH